MANGERRTANGERFFSLVHFWRTKFEVRRFKFAVFHWFTSGERNLTFAVRRFSLFHFCRTKFDVWRFKMVHLCRSKMVHLHYLIYFKYLDIFTDTNFEKNYQQNPIGWLTPKKAANGERQTPFFIWRTATKIWAGNIIDKDISSSNRALDMHQSALESWQYQLHNALLFRSMSSFLRPLSA